MRTGVFSTPSTLDAIVLANAAKILAQNQDMVISEWARAYSLLDIKRILSKRAFTALCRREFNRLITKLEQAAYDHYWDEMCQTAHDLIGKGLSLGELTGLISHFEAGCSSVLFEKGLFSDRYMVVVASFLRNTLSTILTSVIEAKNASLSAQMTVSHTVEAAFRPWPPPAIPGIDLGIKFSPMPGPFEAGGDFYDFFCLPDDRVAFTLGDASGHGVDAMAVATMTKFMLRSFAAEHEKPGTILERTNHALSVFLNEGEFVTALLGIYCPGTKRLIIANAGHPHPIHLPAANSSHKIETAGPALGVIANLSFPDREIWLDHSDLIFIYTDGLTEARRRSGELFGEERIVEALAAHNNYRAQECVDAVEAACLAFCHRRLKDDLTILALRAI